MQFPVAARLASRAPVPRVRHLATPAVLAVALLTAGCAANDSPPYRVAGPPPEPQRHAKVEIEDDGLPAQLAPRNRRPVPDDPTEPWSPNYGSAAAGAPALAAPARLAVARAAVPVREAHVSQPIPAASHPMDPDNIIRQAIAEHERRRR
jgi:hypothetical protein